MSTTRRAATVAVLALLGLGLAGCGGGDKADTQGPASTSPSATPSSSPTTSPSATPTLSEAPLSRFEDLGPVKGARAWADTYSREINRRDKALSALRALSTSGADLALYTREDLQQDNFYRGPLPFTPLRLVKAGSVVHVVSCLQQGGWSLDRKTKQPTSTLKIIPVTFDMTKTGGRWRLAALNSYNASCDGVSVKAVPF